MGVALAPLPQALVAHKRNDGFVQEDSVERNWRLHLFSQGQVRVGSQEFANGIVNQMTGDRYALRFQIPQSRSHSYTSGPNVGIIDVFGALGIALSQRTLKLFRRLFEARDGKCGPAS